MQRGFRNTSLFVLLNLAAAPALAEPSELGPPSDAADVPIEPAENDRYRNAAAPRMQLQPPPLQPPAPRTYHRHDGFYLRLSLGPGILGASVNHDDDSVRDYSGTGFALDLDVLVGGTPSPGVALGGAMILAGGSTTGVEVEGADEDAQTGLTSGILAFFVDGFPDQNRGFHLGGGAGLAWAKVTRGSNDGDIRDHDGIGVGIATWLGYGGWVGPDWTLGGKLRFAGSLTGDEKNGLTQTTRMLSLALMFSAVYH